VFIAVLDGRGERLLVHRRAAWKEGRYDADGVAEVAHVFTARSDDEPTCPDGEVAEVAWVPLADLRAWVAEHRVCPDSVALVLPHLLG
jgi:isopentenyldiphosphate isomerase